MTANITINSDLGEDIGIHSFGNDEAILKIVDTVNIACGMQPGTPAQWTAPSGRRRPPASR